MSFGSIRVAAGLALAHLVRRPNTSADALDGLEPGLAAAAHQAVAKARQSRGALASLIAKSTPRRTERVRALPPRARTLAASTWSPQERAAASGFLNNLPAARPGYAPPRGLAQAMLRRRTPAEQLACERHEVELVQRLLREVSSWDE